MKLLGAKEVRLNLRFAKTIAINIIKIFLPSSEEALSPNKN